MTAEKKVIFTQDYNKRRGPTHGSSTSTFTKEDQYHMNIAKQMASAGADQAYQRIQNQSQSRPFMQNRPFNGDRSHTFNGRLNFSSNNRPFQKRENSYGQNNSQRWPNNQNFSRSPSGPRRPENRKSRPQTPPKPVPFSAFGRSQSAFDFTPYDQKFPPNNDRTSSNSAQFSTTEDSVNEISNLCPLNC